MDIVCRHLINEICLVFPAIFSMIGYIMMQQIEYAKLHVYSWVGDICNKEKLESKYTVL